jgi:hypothetical protein
VSHAEKVRTMMRTDLAKAVVRDHPELLDAAMLKVGPHYTIEPRGSRWEVKYGEGHYGWYEDLHQAIAAITIGDDEVTIPQDISIVPLADVLRAKFAVEDYDDIKGHYTRLTELMASLDYAIDRRDRDMIHNAARNVRLCAGSLERQLKGMR